MHDLTHYGNRFQLDAAKECSGFAEVGSAISSALSAWIRRNCANTE